jgi:hypothetical protein
MELAVIARLGEDTTVPIERKFAGGLVVGFEGSLDLAQADLRCGGLVADQLESIMAVSPC